MAFVHLHVHSEYSLLQSAAKIPALVREAAKMGYKAMALTDIDAMHGVIPFYKECLEHGIKPLIGVELGAAEKHSEARGEAPHRLLFIARNNKGYRALLKLTSKAQTKENAAVPYITFEELESDLEGVIIISPFENGEIQHLVEQGMKTEADKLLAMFRRLAGEENVYIEIQNHWRRQERERLLAIRDWLLENQVPAIASNHVHFIKKEQIDAHRTLHAIRLGESLSELPEYISSQEYYLKDKDEMKQALPSWQEAIEESGRIAERCHVEIQLGTPVLPHFPVPEGQSARNLLHSLCVKGVKERYSSPDSFVWERLKFELNVISNMKYEDYFLIVADFMNYAHEKGIMTGPGRGSAAGSLVAYVLKITNVDPVKYGLLFERFLNPERVSMPDIDIDFSDQQRDEVIHYVADKYGKNHVAQIVTFGTLAAKAAIRDAGRVLGIEPSKIDKVAKLITGRSKLREAVKENTVLKDLVTADDELIELFKIAGHIEGLPRHISVHAAGVVISKEPLTDVVPLQKGHEGLFLTQYPMGDLEDIGLLKMDFLGLRNLSFIGRILNLIYQRTGERLSISSFPPDDKKTFDLLGQGDTSGIFQLESSGMKSVLLRLKPSHFEDIVAVNALYRPGPMENIPSYIERKHGQADVTFPHPDLKEILEPTYGVLIYQEQIMQIASKMAGFSLGEADVLRRAVGKKKREVLEETRAQFVNGSVKKGYSYSEAEEVYNLIVRFADYGFNRSHAVAYSMISYQLAYLKANYPLEFLNGLMDMFIHHQEKLADYIAEAKRKGISVNRPSIVHSLDLFHTKDGTIWIGLAALKNVGLPTVKKLIEEREKGHFESLFDLCARLPGRLLPRRALESLIFSGTLDDFKVDRAVLMASLDDALAYGEKEREKQTDGQQALFFEEASSPVYTKVSPLSVKDRLRYEKEVLGFYASGHPVGEEAKWLAEYGRKRIFDVKEINDAYKSVRVAGFIEDIRVIQTKKKEQMAFLRLSDDSGEMEVTVFPKIFRSFKTKLQKEEMIFAEGRMQEHKGDWKLILDKCISLEDLKRKKQEQDKPVLYLFISKVQEKKGILEELKKVLQDTPGEVPVVLKYESSDKALRLSEMWNVRDDEAFILKLQGLLGSSNVYLKKPRV
ncbi:DNA polymerase III subunit alpha [Salipaludibacillus aurantiacus]|uniref:DNA polymerase III subunit alpha n=1 Tax=Salipaludibacillus aurantiacus TaxID=1601833 RepID=A0A1H9SX79_9BACI|nr:DNA polymerase III subunit alpha [Salipaludibacillus aurantiacus]SER89457.1 DNA polymerase-3 subunit alpha [Salipaludibacillus aurantiacus]